MCLSLQDQLCFAFYGGDDISICREIVQLVLFFTFCFSFSSLVGSLSCNLLCYGLIKFQYLGITMNSVERNPRNPKDSTWKR